MEGFDAISFYVLIGFNQLKEEDYIVSVFRRPTRRGRDGKGNDGWKKPSRLCKFENEGD